MSRPLSEETTKRIERVKQLKPGVDSFTVVGTQATVESLRRACKKNGLSITVATEGERVRIFRNKVR